MGARTPPMLPHKFIHHETEPVYFPPKEITVDQLALIEKPKAPSETDIQKIFISALGVFAAIYNPKDVIATPAIAVIVRIVYWRSAFFPFARWSETYPATNTMAINAIQGKLAQTPMDFNDKLCTSVKYRGSHAKNTYMM